MIFDTWGGALSDAAYREFSLAYSRRVLEGLTREREGRVVPRILFTKGGGLWLEAMAEAGADALGVDWQTPLGDARRCAGRVFVRRGIGAPAATRSNAASISSASL